MMFTVPYNPEMNSVAERLNRTLQERATTMLIASELEQKFWNEANYLKNRSPTSAVGKQFESKTPAEIWFRRKPDLSHLRIFGSECYNYIPTNNRSNLLAKSTKCIFLGYTTSMGSYRLWDTEQSKLVIGRHVTFKLVLNRMKVVEIPSSEAEANQDYTCGMDKMMKDQSNSSEDSFTDAEKFFEDGVYKDDTKDIKNKIHSANKDCISNDNDNVLIPRRSERNRRAPDRYGSWDVNAYFALSAEQFVENNPLTIEEAKQRPDWPKWKEAIKNEYHSLMKNNTWTLCELPKDRKTISSRFVFKLKRKANGEIDKYKARLVTRGFSQKQSFDYSKTYALVAKLTTLRVLLAIANEKKMWIHQMDVKSAFLNGKLTDEIYMQLPEEFNTGKLVCKLNKSLYGLKQASRWWNARLNEFMLRIGFKKSTFKESD